jgi:hypothetical protein
LLMSRLVTTDRHAGENAGESSGQVADCLGLSTAVVMPKEPRYNFYTITLSFSICNSFCG